MTHVEVRKLIHDGELGIGGILNDDKNRGEGRETVSRERRQAETIGGPGKKERTLFKMGKEKAKGKEEKKKICRVLLSFLVAVGWP